VLAGLVVASLNFFMTNLNRLFNVSDLSLQKMICVVLLFERMTWYFLSGDKLFNIYYICSKCNNKNLGEKIMKKTNSVSVFNEISLNFKGEIQNVNLGRGGGDTLSE
jgi:hypothetical protein